MAGGSKKTVSGSKSVPGKPTQQDLRKLRSGSTSTSQEANVDAEFDLSDPTPPDGVHPIVYKLLVMINDKSNTIIETNEEIKEDITKRCEDNEESITDLKSNIALLTHKVDMLSGRLLRAEYKCTRLESQLEDMKAHSMSNNLLINTNKYKEKKNENPREIVKKFFKNDMKIKDAGKINIQVAHRMGTKTNNNERTIIAKIPNSDDMSCIMKHTPNLKDSHSYIEKQLPASMQERRKMVVPHFKAARDAGKKAVIKNDKLYIGGSLERQYMAQPLPEGMKSFEPNVETGETVEDSGSVFSGYADRVKNLDEVRGTLDELLSDTKISKCTHVMYAFKIGDLQNFDSDGDWGIGSGLLRHLQQVDSDNVMIIATRNCSPNFEHIGKKRIEHSISVCEAALTSLESELEQSENGSESGD